MRTGLQTIPAYRAYFCSQQKKGEEKQSLFFPFAGMK
jgi:hypothetical protein